MICAPGPAAVGPHQRMRSRRSTRNNNSLNEVSRSNPGLKLNAKSYQRTGQPGATQTCFKKAKGYRGRRSKLFRYAKDATMKGQYWAYRDRKTRKRTFRYLWIQRLNAAARANGMTYSRLAEGLKAAGIGLDRKILADLVVSDTTAFKSIVEQAKRALDDKAKAKGKKAA